MKERIICVCCPKGGKFSYFDAMILCDVHSKILDKMIEHLNSFGANINDHKRKLKKSEYFA